MDGLILTKDDLHNIEAFIFDMPTKYGMPLLEYLKNVAKERAAERDAKENTKTNETPT